MKNWYAMKQSNNTAPLYRDSLTFLKLNSIIARSAVRINRTKKSLLKISGSSILAGCISVGIPSTASILNIFDPIILPTTKPGAPLEGFKIKEALIGIIAIFCLPMLKFFVP